MRTVKDIDKDALSACLQYEKASGKLYWKGRPLSDFPDERSGKIWNTKNAGNEAGSRRYFRGAQTAVVIRFKRRGILAHRVAWILTHGAIPINHVIDHVNGDRWDNRLSNLRLATSSQNNYNSRIRKNNKTGFKGVWWDRDLCKYRAGISIDKKWKALGTFITAEEAGLAYAAAISQHQPQFMKLQ